jgi:phosphate transport system ATP-binding protein
VTEGGPDEKVEQACVRLPWDEVKGPAARRRLRCPVVSSNGCASRVQLATDPELLLFDEPTSALDPIATSVDRGLIFRAQGAVTI